LGHPGGVGNDFGGELTIECGSESALNLDPMTDSPCLSAKVVIGVNADLVACHESFEVFMTTLEYFGDGNELLKPWTKIGVKWATKYYKRMDDTDTYVISMCKFRINTLLLRR